MSDEEKVMTQQDIPIDMECLETTMGISLDLLEGMARSRYNKPEERGICMEFKKQVLMNIIGNFILNNTNMKIKGGVKKNLIDLMEGVKKFLEHAEKIKAKGAH